MRGRCGCSTCTTWATARREVGAVAIPVLTKVAKAHTALEKAQLAYANATTKSGRTAALQSEQKATEGLTGSQKALMGQVAGLQKTWQGLEAAMTPVIVQVTSVALKLANALLPVMDKLVPAGAKLLDAVIGPLTKLVSSPFFAQFTDQMGQLAAQMGGLLGPQLVKLIELFMQLFMQAGPAGIRILSVLLPLIIQLATDLVPVITVVAGVVAAILEWLQKTHLLIPLLALIAIVILALEAPITAVIIAIALLVAAGVELGKHWGQIWHAIAHYFDEGRHFIAHVFDLILHYASIPLDWIKAHWPLLLAILTGPIGIAVYVIKGHWGQVTAGAARMFHDVVSFFEQLPGRILHALGDLGHLLWNVGISILKGLLGGLLQQWNDITNFIGGIGSWISSHKGPIEVDAVLLRPHGRAIMGGLRAGLEDGMPGLSGQMQRTTAAITGGARGGHGGGYGGGGRGQLELVLRFTPSGNAFLDAFMRELRGEVRRVGGDPDMFQRKVAFR
jgi:phage-related protein